MTENEKIAAFAKTGDLKLLGELYADYMHLVLGVCMKYLKNRQDAEDAVMQIYEKLVLDLRKHSVTNFKSWLYVTTKNYCLMELRKTNKVKNYSLDDMEYSLPAHPNDEEEKEWSEDAVDDCMQKLPELQKKAVHLFFFKELCYKEITDQLKVDFNKIKSAIQNGKRNLKICLEKNSE